MKNKVAIIAVYMGRLPDYHEITKKTIFHNNEYNWFIFTDQVSEIVSENNLTYLPYSLEMISRAVSDIFGKEIKISNCHKLCDIRPMFGEIFKEYLKNFDWWGFCDLDVIYGNFGDWLSDDILNDYEVITYFTKEGTLFGPFTLIKNTPKLVNLYKKIPDIESMIAAGNGSYHGGGYIVDEVHFAEVMRREGIRCITGVERNGKKIPFMRFGRRKTPARIIAGRIEVDSYMQDYPAHNKDLFGIDTMAIHLRGHHRIIGDKIISLDDIVIENEDPECENIRLDFDIKDNYSCLLLEYCTSIISVNSNKKITKIFVNDLEKSKPLAGLINYFYPNIVFEKNTGTDNCVIIKKPGKFNCVSTTTYGFMRKSLVKKENSPKKIIINGKGAEGLRQIYVDFLKERGFIEFLLEDISVEERCSLFFNATHIVLSNSPMAANLIFCGKGCNILEINNGHNPSAFVGIAKYFDSIFGLKIGYCTIFSDFIMNKAEFLPDDLNESEISKSSTFGSGRKKQFSGFFRLNRQKRYIIPLLKDDDAKCYQKSNFEISMENLNKYFSVFMESAKEGACRS